MERLAYSVDDAAEILGWSASSVRRAIRQGDLARVPHTGHRVLVARLELERFAAQGVMEA